MRMMSRSINVGIILSFALTTQAQQPTPQDKSSQRSATAIAGHVMTRDGESLGNALVSVSRLGNAGPSDNVKVDANGNFKTDDLSPGLYRVFASVPGYISEPATAATNAGIYHPGDSVNFTMIKGGVITGTVKNSSDAPVIAVPVRAVRVRDQNGKVVPFPIAYRERLTDDRGVYRLYGLPPGTYLVSAGGSQRTFGVTPPTAYETDAPTYAPSSTRDTASEVTVNNGDEVNADIQYRGEPGHAVTGTIAGAESFQGQLSLGVSISLTARRTGAQFMSTSTSTNSNFAFGFYGVPDEEYELYAVQNVPSRDWLASAPKRIKVQGADVTGINLTVAPLGAIEGRVVFESDAKASCGKRASSAMLETIVYARRYRPEAKPAANSPVKTIQEPNVPRIFENAVGESIVDGKGGFRFRNVRAGTYRIDPREPASGWYLRSITVEPAKTLNVPRDGLAVKTGERISGLLVTITEGAAKLRGRISRAEGQSLSPALRVYLVPSERDAADNVLRFSEARPENDGSFLVDNIAPGKYWIVARPVEENDIGVAKSIKQDGAFRSKVVRDAETLKQDLTFKPCEQIDYELPLTSTISPQ
jgi:hypothetical protein